MKPSGSFGDAQTSIAPPSVASMQFLPPRSELTTSVASIAPLPVAIDQKNTTNSDKFRQIQINFRKGSWVELDT